MPQSVRTTTVLFKGDEKRGRELQGMVRVQLEKLRSLMSFAKLDQYTISTYNREGAYIKASSCFGTETVTVYVPPKKPVNPEEEIKKQLMRRKLKMKWELAYVPEEPPDPQPGGWFEADKATLLATEVLENYSSLAAAGPGWDSQRVLSVTSGVASEVTNEGYVDGNQIFNFGAGDLYAATKTYQATRIAGFRYRTRYAETLWPFAVTYDVTSWNNAVVNFQSNAYAAYNSYGGFPSTWYDGVMQLDPTHGFYGGIYQTGWIGWGSGVYMNISDSSAYYNWQSPSLGGFTRMQWLDTLNPSSIKDADNYTMYYDVCRTLHVDGTYQMPKNYFTWWPSFCDSSSDAVIYNWREFHGSGSLACTFAKYAVYQATAYTPNAYAISLGAIPSTIYYIMVYPSFAPFADTTFGNTTYFCPDHNYNCRGFKSTYETKLIGKYKGVDITSTLGTATRQNVSGGGVTSPQWTGVSAIPHTSNIYSKEKLYTGDDPDDPLKHEDDDLVVYSYHTGVAGGNYQYWPGFATGTGITETTYVTIMGGTTVTKAYAAVHPGTHPVFSDTETGINYRAYGSLYAVLRPIGVGPVEFGPPEWLGWWFADNSQFIVEMDKEG